MYTYSVYTQGKHRLTNYIEITKSHISCTIISNPLSTIRMKLNTDQQINTKACHMVICQCRVPYKAHLLVSAFHILPSGNACNCEWVRQLYFHFFWTKYL